MPDELSQEELAAISDVLYPDSRRGPTGYTPAYLDGFKRGWLAHRTYEREQNRARVEKLAQRVQEEIRTGVRYDAAEMEAHGKSVSPPEAKSHGYPLEGFDLSYRDGTYRVSVPKLLEEGERLHVVPASRLTGAEVKIAQLRQREEQLQQRHREYQQVLVERAEKAEEAKTLAIEVSADQEQRAIAAEGEVKRLREDVRNCVRWETNERLGREKAEADVKELLQRADDDKQIIKQLRERIEKADQLVAELRKEAWDALGWYREAQEGREKVEARVQELERIVVDALPELKTIAAALKPADTQPAECPYCPDGHRRPGSKPMTVVVGPERDSDGQPTTIHVSYAAGYHVSDAEARWLRALIASADTQPADPDPKPAQARMLAAQILRTYIEEAEETMT